MDATFTPEMLMMAGAIVLVAVLLAAWYFYRRAQLQTQHHPYGVDHSQAITDLANRTRAEAERKERELLGDTAPRAAR